MRYWFQLGLATLLTAIMIVSMAIYLKDIKGKGHSADDSKTYNFLTLTNSNIERQAQKLIDDYLKSLTEENFTGKSFSQIMLNNFLE